MVQGRGSLVGSLNQPTQQGHHPFLQAHPMDQPVLGRFQLLTLLGIVQLGGFEIQQQLLLLLPFLLQLLPIAPGRLQGGGRLFPVAVGQRHGA